MNIGETIKQLRKERRTTQEELAEYLHISPQAVSKWETGASSPDIDMIPKLAIYFGTTPDRLLDFDQSRLDEAIQRIIEASARCGDPAKAEAYLRQALEKYPNNDLLLTCILEDMQEQNRDGSRSAEIIEIGERVLNCTKDDELRIDIYRIMAETYHSMDEQAMAEAYLARIPALHFMYYEIAAAIKTGAERLKNVESAESLCIDKLISMLWLRREEASAAEKAEIDAQARAMLSLFKAYPAYSHIAELMESAWNDGSIPDIYR